MAHRSDKVGLGLPRLGVEQICGRHIGQRLRCGHVPLVEGTSRRAVKAEGPQATPLVAEWEREDRYQSYGERTLRESGEAVVLGQVRNRDRFASFVGCDTWPLGERGLQRL